ncbi:MAG: GNAT family N-acetyltransferase [Myxococcaceae bacterium]
MFRSLLRQKTPNIRPVERGEMPFVADLARNTLSLFGKYDRLLPEWMRQPGIRTFIAEHHRQPAGLCMFGYFEDPQRGLFADLLALAVAPQFQHLGLGRALLRFVIEESRRSGRVITELRLSVADTNERARALFASEGFRPLPYEIGTYDGGQVALRMGLRLDQSATYAA